jgi:hypothetical protein
MRRRLPAWCRDRRCLRKLPQSRLGSDDADIARRPSSSMRLRTWTATFTSVIRRSSIRERSQSPITCFHRPIAASTLARSACWLYTRMVAAFRDGHVAQQPTVHWRRTLGQLTSTCIHPGWHQAAGDPWRAEQTKRPTTSGLRTGLAPDPLQDSGLVSPHPVWPAGVRHPGVLMLSIDAPGN